MNATIIARTTTSFTLQVEIPYNDSMLDFEEALQDRLNEAGVVATAEGLQQFDTDGSPITVGPVKFTSKGRIEKDYQTPYGVATVARHVYQSPQGGPTYCPLDRAPGSWSAPPPASPRSSRTSTPSSAPPGPGGPRGEPRPGGVALPDPGPRRCGGGGGPGQGGGRELCPAEVRRASATVASDRLESLLQVDARRPRARLRLCDPGLAGPGDGAGLPAPSVGTPAPIGSHPNRPRQPGRCCPHFRKGIRSLENGYTFVEK